VSKITAGKDLFDYKEEILNELNKIEELSAKMFEYTDKVSEDEEKEILVGG
jgi:hypothetical protein